VLYGAAMVVMMLIADLGIWVSKTKKGKCWQR
jgi:hypothetical protein